MDVLVLSRGFAEELDGKLAETAMILSRLVAAADDDDVDASAMEDELHDLRTRLVNQLRYSTEVVD